MLYLYYRYYLKCLIIFKNRKLNYFPVNKDFLKLLDTFKIYILIAGSLLLLCLFLMCGLVILINLYKLFVLIKFSK